MKKFLALLMAAAMLFSFAACGDDKKDDETTTETTTENVAANVDAEGEEETDAEGEEETEEEVTEVVTDESGEAVTDKEGHAVTEKVTKKDSKKPTKKNEKATSAKKDESAEKAVSQWTKQEIVDYYNAAVKKTDASSNPPAGHSKMSLKGKITADGGILGTVLPVVSPIVESTLERNSNETHNIPGEGKLEIDDVKTIKATEKNGVITVEMTIKEQIDGPTADGSAGHVGHAIGTLGNLDKALNELGATISEGKENVKLTYDDVTIKANINQKTGMVTGGKWHYNVNIAVSYAKIKLGVSFKAENLKAVLDYTVTF